MEATIEGAKTLGNLVAKRAFAKNIYAGGFRSQRLPLSRPDQGSRRCSSRRWTEVLMEIIEWQWIITMARQRRGQQEESEFEDKVIHINRCAKVVKGGRRFSFAAIVVVGDKKGQVGVGLGKAGEVPEAIKKAGKQAKKNLMKVPLEGEHHSSRGDRSLRRKQGSDEASSGRYRNHRELVGSRDS